MNNLLKVKLNRGLLQTKRCLNTATGSSILDQLLKTRTDDGSLALVSLSKNIHYNLALENYLAETAHLKKRNILLLWTSEPCIVFGRHQNPWLECNVKQSQENGVRLARRYSGGGCVYHDHGNLNISFITDRAKYDREINLNLIKNTLESLQFKDISFEISPRHDIYMTLQSSEADEKFKISGTASRLAQKFAYHHCTLLFDLDIANMRLLKSNLASHIITKATPSVRSKCLSLKPFSSDPTLSMTHVIEKLCAKFWHVNLANWSIEHLFAYINPEEAHISKLIETHLVELTSWDYIFGTTPKFQLNITLESANEIRLNIVKGVIHDYEVVEKEHAKFSADDLCTLKRGLDLLVNCKLDKTDLVKCFSENSLVSLHSSFTQIFNFLNKHF